MLEVAEAQRIINQEAKPLTSQVVALSSNCLNRSLADDVHADRDSPPFTKSLMDGYAVRSADLAEGPCVLTLVEEIPAGAVPTRAIQPSETAALFTGAPLPIGADAVVMKEQIELLKLGRVRVPGGVKPGLNVLPRGQEMKVGEVVCPKGTVITPVGLGVLATVGATAVSLVRTPRVSILATGDELVEPGVAPGPGQIRNSNGPLINALATLAGAETRYLGIARDDRVHLASRIREGLDHSDIFILAGGVSAGKYDLVPEVLHELGMKAHFHKIRMKPGKPLLFGTKDQTLVFGLPGNPVSVFVCFELFVKPALRLLRGAPDPGPRTVHLPLAEPLTTSNDRPTYAPAMVERAEIGYRVRPLAWFGSADLRGLLRADALIVLPAGPVQYNTMDPVEVIRIC